MVGEPRTQRVEILLTEREKNRLEEMKDRYGMSMGEIVRTALFMDDTSGLIDSLNARQLTVEKYTELLKVLSNIASYNHHNTTNINQIAYAYNKNPSTRDYEKDITQLKNLQRSVLNYTKVAQKVVDEIWLYLK